MKLTVDKIAAKLGHKVDLTNEEELDLSGLKIDEVGSFKRCSSLLRLNLSNNGFANLKQIEGLFHLQQLEELDLSGCPITHNYGYRSAVIDKLPNLRILDGMYSNSTYNYTFSFIFIHFL
ncbi:MAG: hypothetical protein EZS28_017164 [Streblomastix strix]|uniref:Uncharacterized protein n=1 Tax=Streblomastix strix TaxID=222440 RepID=A0A5J4VYM1_9EUKA|nr:MAG: hypothetical protein EZS28_017164 [Streblomastix strix]